mmetsp:Transcript_43386/g.108740  ORF Transcript_43386/g.108740 Transcript_43386/m.108740 type:complete len:281 (+) Transcript_43386:181-1023(+)
MPKVNEVLSFTSAAPSRRHRPCGLYRPSLPSIAARWLPASEALRVERRPHPRRLLRFPLHPHPRRAGRRLAPWRRRPGRRGGRPLALTRRATARPLCRRPGAAAAAATRLAPPLLQGRKARLRLLGWREDEVPMVVVRSRARRQRRVRHRQRDRLAQGRRRVRSPARRRRKLITGARGVHESGVQRRRRHVKRHGGRAGAASPATTAGGPSNTEQRDVDGVGAESMARRQVPAHPLLDGAPRSPPMQRRVRAARLVRVRPQLPALPAHAAMPVAQRGEAG